MENSEGKLPKDPESYWITSTELEKYPQLNEDLEVEVAIIGAGITGITTAYNLIKEGFQVAVFEASTVLNGTTGHTTAKITAQHGLLYDELINHFGEESARLYYEANDKAKAYIEECIQLHGIECDFQKEDAYMFAMTENELQSLRTEAKAYERLGIDGGFVDHIPLDVNSLGALVMKKQAQFHPLHYLAPLLQYVTENGGVIYENSVATKMDDGDDATTVFFRDGQKVRAKYVISASHFPFHDGQAFMARLEPKRSYVLAVKSDKSFPGGMYINAGTPARSVRAAKINGEELLLIVGDGHKTGQGEPEINHYKALEAFAEETFGAKEILYRWSAQDLVTLDKVPYIGKISADHDRVFVATGFRKWGMTSSTVAALLITDLMLGRDNPYAEIFSPSRFVADPGIKKLVKANLNVAAHLIGGKLDTPDKELKDVKDGEGAAVSIKGKRAGAYKTESGELFIVDTKCTHMGCEVNWNSGDRTWDCPCHGSRFSYEGEVIEGPAERPLKRIDPDSIDYTRSK